MKRATAAMAMALAAWAAAPSPAWAQKPIPESIQMMEPHRLRIGDYVRAWPTAKGPSLQGSVVAVSATTLTLAGHEEAELVDLPLMDRMEIRHIHNHYLRNTLIGAGLGAVASALLVTREIFGRPVRGWERAGWTSGLTAGGAVVGLGVARLTQSAVWEPVDLVTLRPHAADARGLRLSYTLHF